MKPGEWLVNVAEDGGLPRLVKLAIGATLKQLAGHAVTIRIEKYRSTRSNQQNRYYRGPVLKAFSAYTGYTRDECHDLCKRKFLPKTLALSDGNGVVVDEFVIGGSTRKLNTLQMTEYIEAIRDWLAAYCGIVVEDPNPDWREAEQKERAA